MVECEKHSNLYQIPTDVDKNLSLMTTVEFWGAVQNHDLDLMALFC